MNPVIPDDIEALALADAAGALDPDEQRELQQKLASAAPDVRSRVSRLYETTALLAAEAPFEQPAAGVRDRLMARITGPSRYTLGAGDGEWVPTPLPGIQIKVLAIDRPRDLVTMLIRAEPGARYPSHTHSTAEECYVIRGSVVIEGRVLRPGDFHHADAHSDHGEITTTEGAEVLIVGSIDDYLPDAAQHG
jgi:anti-sigma factor ChrR (cupin superfamily)